MSFVAWRAIGVVVILGFVASALAASRMRPGRGSRVERQILAAAVLGGMPAIGIFIIAWSLPGGLVAGLALGCGVGGLLGAAGAWFARDRRDGCPRPVLAFVGTLAGATVGSAICGAVIFAVFVSDGQLRGELMVPLAAGYVGSCAALGFQIGAG